jgi:hypothetical protein
MSRRHSPLILWRLSAVLALTVLTALLPRHAAAQAVSGTIIGTVTDSSGAVISGAKVSVVNEETGLTRTLTSDAHGEFQAPSMPTGSYTLTAEMQGFKLASASNIQLGVDQRLRVDLKLEIGAMTETVSIEAARPLVQTSSSDLSATVNQKQIETLPLNGRNFVQLTRTVPGVARGIPGANIDGAGSLAWRASASFSANGQRPRDNNYMLDGIDNNEDWLQTVVLFPSVDALDEFKLQTSTYSAEFGRSLGGVVNIQIKSGTNNVHGSGFEFLRNDAFDANNFFNNKNGRKKPDFSQHMFGGTLGGPINKDRTFFFADYQGQRTTQGQTYLSTVPTAKMRNGDFSEINRVIYNPLTNQPFAGNVIPQNMWDPAAKNILQQLYPEPNVAGTVSSTGQTINNYLINPNLERQDNQFDVKVDHSLSDSNRFFSRYSYEKTHRFLPATLPKGGDAGQTFGAGDGNIKAQGLAFNDTHIFGPSWLNELRVGWSSIKFFMTSIDYGKNLAQQVGIPGINLNEVTSAMSQLTFQNIRNMGANGNQPLITNQNDWQFYDNITRTMGKHTLKAGGSLTFRSREILNADSIVGVFAFNSNQTSNCGGITSGCTLNTATGFDVASFLLGYASSKNRRLFDSNTYTEQRPEYGVYFQDDFRATSRLTLNLGARWDVYVPWVEKDNRQSNFDPATGRFVVASDNAVINGQKVGRYLQTYSKADVGPRLGFAYDVDGSSRTVIRGGYGIFWNFTPGGTSSSKAQNPPFLQSQSFTSNFGTDLVLSQGLPAPPGVNPDAAPAGATRSAFDINFRDGYSHQFNVNVQRQLGSNYMVEVAYVGSRSRQMLVKDDYNQAPPVLGQTNQNVNRPYFALWPALGQIGTVTSKGFLNYNGLLLKFSRRFANGFSVYNAYTWGKGIDLASDNDGTVSFTNVYDKNYNRGPSDYDVTHTFSSNFIYALPYLGRDTLWGGWSVSGIVYLRGGLPLTITQTQGVSSTGTGNRPNRIGNGLAANPTIDQWFDPSAFQAITESTATYGNSGRGILRGPGQKNVDFSVIKATKFGRFEHELRIEAFNLFNHPQFGNPNTTLGNAAFGTISTMLANASCALCGTTERQVQVAMKLKF